MNRTNLSGTTSDAAVTVPVPPIFVLTAFVFGTLVCLTSFLAICVLIKCQKIVDQIRLTSIHLCIANFGYGLTMDISCLYYLITSSICGGIFSLVHFFCLLYFIFLTFTGIDRLLSLTFSMKYKLWSRKHIMYIVAAVAYFMAVILGYIPNIPQEGLFQCQGEYLTFGGFVSYITTMLLLITIYFCCFASIGYITWKKSTPGPFESGNDYTPYLKITKTMVKLGFTSFLLSTPYLVTGVYYIANFHHGDPAGSVGVASYISTSLLYVHQFVSPIFIMVSYHECRFVFLNAFLCCCPNLKQRLQQEYRKYYATYEIPTIQR